MSIFACKQCVTKRKNMGFKRNEVAEPRWDFLDYAVKSKEDLFSAGRWGETVNWNIILKQVEKTRQASQMIDIDIYPSKLFFTAIDLLEANLLMVDDLFYYLTGIRITKTKIFHEEVRNRLGFWNMDSYKVLNQIREGLLQANVPLVQCLRQEPIWDISLKVVEKSPMSAASIGSAPICPDPISGREAYKYACEYYKAAEIDQEALATQIANIQDLIRHYRFYFWGIYGKFTDFSRLLELFCQSEIAQTEYIEPWRHDFGGTRDSLIAKMEKDPKLGPWVHRYDHLPKMEDVHLQLFYDEKDPSSPTNEEECYNTANWISLLTIAAVLQEYDEQHNETGKGEDPDLPLKLMRFFDDKETAERFLDSIRGMGDRHVINMVYKYYDKGMCSETSKDLWQLLYDSNYFKTKYRNWNGLLNNLLKKGV